MNADTRRSTRAVDSPDRPSTILRKQPGAVSPNASTRQSVRYPNAAAAAAASRYSHSRSSVRASVRQPGQPGLSGLSGHLDREVRVQVLDEEGRDRTPKPLLAARPHGGGSNLAAEVPGSGGWGGDSPEPTSLFASSDRHSLHGHPHGALLPSPAGFAWVDALAEAGPPQPLRRPSQVLKPAQPGSKDSSANADAACAAQLKLSGTARAAPMQRAEATQHEPAPTANKSCQVLPWELASAASAAEAAQQDEAAAEVDTTLNGSSGTGTQEPSVGAQPEDGAEQEAMQALQGAALQQDSSLAVAGGRGSQLRGDVYADRSSRAGCSSRASLAPHDQSRRTSCASVREGGDSSERASMMSRGSMAAYSGGEGLQGGRPSYMGSGPSLSGRSSAMAPGYRQHTSSMSGAEAAAEAAKRQKAEAQRATARLPGIHPALQRVERLLAQNAFHPVVAKCKQLQPGGRVAFGEPGAAAAAGAAGVAGEAMAAAGVEAGGAVVAGAGTGGAAGAGEGETAGTGSVGSMASAEPQELWQWRCEAAEELPVSCIAWNKASPDLLAVGYGQLDYSVAARGVVAFFSLTNPAHPVWHLSTPCGVSSLDFSRRAGGQLAVGMFDGSVAVYDVRGRSAVPANRAPPTAPDGSGGHAEPVWSIRYVGGGTSEGEGSGGEELLVSVSTDGRVLSWKHTQSLDCTNLVRLKRQAGGAAQVRQGGQGAQTDGLLGRQAGGTCFDFSPADPRTYLVGTEEGQVHKCSTAFTEQYIQTYAGHAAPVYQVHWCPFRPSVFLTASADWTMRLWLESRRNSLWTFQQTHFKSDVNDIQWCPRNSTVFAAAAGNSLQLWDLEQSLLKPRTSLTRYGMRLTTVCFNPAAPVLVCGAVDGSVAVYSCAGLYREGSNVEEESRRLEGVLRALVEQHLVQ